MQQSLNRGCHRAQKTSSASVFSLPGETVEQAGRSAGRSVGQAADDAGCRIDESTEKPARRTRGGLYNTIGRPAGALEYVGEKILQGLRNLKNGLNQCTEKTVAAAGDSTAQVAEIPEATDPANSCSINRNMIRRAQELSHRLEQLDKAERQRGSKVLLEIWQPMSVFPTRCCGRNI